jgi:hypothetical protein
MFTIQVNEKFILFNFGKLKIFFDCLWASPDFLHFKVIQIINFRLCFSNGFDMSIQVLNFGIDIIWR